MPSDESQFRFLQVCTNLENTDESEPRENLSEKHFHNYSMKNTYLSIDCYGR